MFRHREKRASACTRAGKLSVNRVKISVEPDAWLGARLGCAAYRVQAASPDECTDTGAQLEKLLRQRGFFYARVPAAEVAICNYLVERGFRIVDTCLTFELKEYLTPLDANAAVRFAVPADRDGVMSVARDSFRYSRFHLDPYVPKSTADEIKACWAGNYFTGQRGNFMVVADVDARIAAFLQLLSPDEGPLTIDLIAVEERVRGKGLARAMIRFAAERCPNPIPMRVGTQAANVGSVRLYESLGFRMISSAYVLHAVGGGNAAGNS